MKNEEDEYEGIEYFIIEEIFKRPEDQLLKFINELYLKDKKYSTFYEFVIFSHVEIDNINEFIEIFDTNDLTRSTWLSICDHLRRKIISEEEEEENNKEEKNKNTNRTHKYNRKRRSNAEKIKNFIEIKTKEFNGILNYLQSHSNIKDEIIITASSRNSGDLFNLLKYYDLSGYFATNNEQNSWICFKFKKHQIIPSSYIIRSCNVNECHPRTWTFEGSSDNKKWTTLDEQKSNDFLNGKSRVHFWLCDFSKKEIKKILFRDKCFDDYIFCVIFLIHFAFCFLFSSLLTLIISGL